MCILTKRFETLIEVTYFLSFGKSLKIYFVGRLSFYTQECKVLYSLDT